MYDFFNQYFVMSYSFSQMSSLNILIVHGMSF